MKRDQKGIMVVVSAPSGTGKTTIIDELLKENPELFVRTVSCTTRPPRRGEKDKIDYYFLTLEQFEKKKAAGEFLETAEIYGYLYGTLREEVQNKLKLGHNVILIIDIQGAQHLMGKEDAVYIFIEPPSMKELERRIRARKTDTEEVIEKRLSRAKSELKEKNKYDYVVVNDSFKEACRTIKKIIIDESLKRRREIG